MPEMEHSYFVTLRLDERGRAPTEAEVRDWLIQGSQPWAEYGIDLLDVSVDEDG